MRLFPVLARVPLLAAADPRDALDPVTRRRRAFAALRTLFVRLTSDQPVVVALDDLHWADADSALLFEDVFAGPEPPPLLMVGSYRAAGYEQSPFLARFRSAGGRVIRVTPLDVDTGAALARALLGPDADPTVARRIAERAAGHPLHIAELARHAEPTAASEDTRLEAVLTRRFGRLAPGERRLRELGAVAGGPLDRGVAARAAGLSDAAARDALDQLIRDELLRAVPPAAVEVFHDSIRLAVTTVLEARAAQDLHQRLATALIELDAPGDDRLAYHLHRAGQAQDAAPYVLRAAEQATRALAFDRAVVLYERALELGRDVDARGVPLRERLADALTNAGRYADAARVYLELATQAPPERALTLRERAADRFLRSGRLTEGRGVLNEVLAAVGMALPESPFGALLSVAWRRLRLKLRGLRFRARDAAAIPTAALRRVDVAFSVGEGLAPIDLLRGVDFQTRSLLLALKAGDPFRVARSMGVEAVSLATLGPAGRRESARLVDQARAICPDNAEVDAIGHVAGVLAAWHSNRWADAIASADRALAGFEAQGEGKQWERMMADMFGIAARWWLGDLIAFRAMVRERVADARARGELLAELHYSNAMLFPPTLLDGDPERADREIVDVHNRWRQPVVGLPDFYALLSRMNVALYRGRGHDALALAAADVERLGRLGLHRIPMLQLTLVEVRARATLAAWSEGGDGQKLARAFGRHRRAISRLPVPWTEAAGPLLDAQRAGLDGDGPGAAAAYASAETAFERLQMPVFALAARAAAGGEAGRAALDALRARGVAEPLSYVRMLVPAARTG